MQTSGKRGAGGSASSSSSLGKSSFKVYLFWSAVIFVAFVSTLVVLPLTIAWTAGSLGTETLSESSVVARRNGSQVFANVTRRYAAGVDIPWKGGEATFNWHPLMMIIAFVTVMSQSLLSYRVFSRLLLSRLGKGGLKLLHVAMHCLELVFIVLGLAAVIFHKVHEDYEHFTSLHSWMGLLTVVAFSAQMAMGTVFYLLPKRLVGDRLRQLSVHYHRLFGLGIFFLGCASVGLGVGRALALNAAEYPDAAEARLGQAIGILLPFLALPITFVLTRSEYRRRLDPSSKPLLGKQQQTGGGGQQSRTAAVAAAATSINSSGASSGDVHKSLLSASEDSP